MQTCTHKYMNDVKLAIYIGDLFNKYRLTKYRGGCVVLSGV